MKVFGMRWAGVVLLLPWVVAWSPQTVEHREGSSAGSASPAVRASIAMPVVDPLRLIPSMALPWPGPDGVDAPRELTVQVDPDASAGPFGAGVSMAWPRLCLRPTHHAEAAPRSEEPAGMRFFWQGRWHDLVALDWTPGTEARPWRDEDSGSPTLGVETFSASPSAALPVLALPSSRLAPLGWSAGVERWWATRDASVPVRVAAHPQVAGAWIALDGQGRRLDFGLTETGRTLAKGGETRCWEVERVVDTGTAETRWQWAAVQPGDAPQLLSIEEGLRGGSAVVWTLDVADVPDTLEVDAGFLVRRTHRVVATHRQVRDTEGAWDPLRWVHRYMYASGRLVSVRAHAGSLEPRTLLHLRWGPLDEEPTAAAAERHWWQHWAEALPEEGDGVVLWGVPHGVGSLEPVVHRADGRLEVPGASEGVLSSGVHPRQARWLDLQERGSLHLLSGTTSSWQLERLSDGHVVSQEAPLQVSPEDQRLRVPDLWGRGLPDLWFPDGARGAIVAEHRGVEGCVDRNASCPAAWRAPEPLRGPDGWQTGRAEGSRWVPLLAGGPAWWVEPLRDGRGVWGVRAWPPGGTPGRWGAAREWGWAPVACDPGTETFLLAEAGGAAHWVCRVGDRLVRRHLPLDPAHETRVDVGPADVVLPGPLDFQVVRPHGAGGPWVIGWSAQERRWHAVKLPRVRAPTVLLGVEAEDGRLVEFVWTRIRRAPPATALPWSAPASALLPWPVVAEVRRVAAGPWEASMRERWLPGEELGLPGSGFAQTFVAEADLSDETAPERHALHRFGLSRCAPAGVLGLGSVRGGVAERAFWGERRVHETMWVRGHSAVDAFGSADRCAALVVESTQGHVDDPDALTLPSGRLPPGVLRERTRWRGPTRPGWQQSVWRDRVGAPLRASRLRSLLWAAGDAHASWSLGWQEWDGEGRLRAALRLQPDQGASGGGPGRGVVVGEAAWSTEEERWIQLALRRHDDKGRRVEEVDALGRRTRWRWEGGDRDRPSARVLLPPEGALPPPDTDHLEVLWTWSAAMGALVAQRDANGRWWSRVLDARGREVRGGQGPAGTAPDVRHTHYAPRPGVAPARTRTVQDAAPSPDVEDVTWWSSTGDRLAQVRGGVVVVDHERRNAWGEVTTRCNPWRLARATDGLPEPPAGHPCERKVRDALGRVVALEGPVGTQRWVHMPTGVHQHWHERGGGPPIRSVWTRLDAWGEVLERVEGGGEGPVRRWAYERRQRDGMLTLRFPSGARRVWRRDSLGRIVEVDDPAAGRMRHFYDESGRKVATEDATGTLSGTDVDGLGRPMRRWETVDGVERTTVQLRWEREDLQERITEMLQRRWTFDARGRVVVSEVTTAEGRWTSRTDWDRKDRPIAHHYADGSWQPLRWDALGNLVEMPGAFPSIEVDAAGTYVALTTASGWREERSLDAGGRPAHWRLAGHGRTIDVRVNLSAVGEPTVRRTVPAEERFARHQWRYDAWGRLAHWEARGLGSNVFLAPHMDEDDQWLGDVERDEAPCAFDTTPWLPSACGGESLQWDAAGRLLGIGETRLTWGADALPRQMVAPDGTEMRWWMAPDGTVEREERREGPRRSVRIHLDPSQVVEITNDGVRLYKSLAVGGAVRLDVATSLPARLGIGVLQGPPASQGALFFGLLLLMGWRVSRRPWLRLCVVPALLLSCAGVDAPEVPLLVQSGEARWWFHDPLGDRSWIVAGDGPLEGPWSVDPAGHVIEGASLPSRHPGWQGMTPVWNGRMWRAATRLWVPAIGRWASPDPLVLASPATPWRDAQPHARVGGRWDAWEDPSGRIGLRRFIESVASWSPEDFGRLMAGQQAWDDRHWSGPAVQRLSLVSDVAAAGGSLLRGQSPAGPGGALTLTTTMLEGIAIADNAGHYIASAEAEALQLLLVARAGGRAAPTSRPPSGYGPRAQASWSAAAERTQRRVFRWTDTPARTAGAFQDSFEGQGHFGRHAGYHAVAFLSHAASWTPDESARFAEAYFEARTQVQMSQTVFHSFRTNTWLDRSGHQSSVGRWARAIP